METKQIKSLNDVKAGAILVDSKGNKHQIFSVSEKLVWISFPNEFERGLRNSTLEDLQKLGLDNLLI
jgi:hypothetical protein